MGALENKMSKGMIVKERGVKSKLHPRFVLLEARSTFLNLDALS